MSNKLIIGDKTNKNSILIEFEKAFRGLHKNYWIALRTAVLVFINFFECQQCGECCRNSPPSFTEEEAYRIARYLGVKIEDLPLERYVNIIGDEIRVYYRAGKPCPFLKNDKCSIYPVRGAQCRAFPYEWLMYSLIPEYCRGTFIALRKTIDFIKNNFDYLKEAAEYMRTDLQKLASSSKYKNEMRKLEYRPLVEKLFNYLESIRNKK